MPVRVSNAQPPEWVEAPGRFTYLQADSLTVQRAEPSSGPAGGGWQILVMGSAFTGETLVEIGGRPLEEMRVEDALVISGTAPPGEVGHADLIVRDGEQMVTLPAGVRYMEEGLDLTGIEPAQGPAQGGLQVAVTGSGLDRALRILVGSRPLIRLAVDGAGERATGILPPGQGTVDLRVEAPGGD